MCKSQGIIVIKCGHNMFGIVNEMQNNVTLTQSCYPPSPNQLYFKTIWEGVYSQFLQGNEINRRLVSSVGRAPVCREGGRGF